MLTLYLLDEINCKIEGLSESEIKTIRKNTGIMVPNAHNTAAYKAKLWDGKESLFGENGHFFFEMIDIVSGELDKLGYRLDVDVEVSDLRSPPKHPNTLQTKRIDKFFLTDRGIPELRDHQVESINAVLANEKGIINAATSAGKTYICAAIALLYEDYYQSITICPSAYLVEQTFEDYKKLGLDANPVLSSYSAKKRKEIIENTRHIVITPKLFINEAKHFVGKSYTLMIDECHISGDVFLKTLRETLSESTIRIGLTATVPNKTKKKLKRTELVYHVGGDVIYTVPPDYLIQKEYASDIEIKLIEIEDHVGRNIFLEVGQEDWDWEKEEKYLSNHPDRLDMIVDLICKEVSSNCLILCRRDMGVNLSKLTGWDFIDGDIPVKQRQEFFKKFDELDDYKLIATYGTSSTGISVNRIFTEVLLDIGRNETYIAQGIGRSMRLDGVKNFANIFDIFSDTPFSSDQKRDRLKFYNKQKYKWKEYKKPLLM